MENEVEHVTTEEYATLKQKCAELEAELEKLRLYKGEEAVFAGDMWHDNPTLYRVEMEERVLMRRIWEAQQRVKKAVVVEIKHETNIVAIGSTVELQFSDGDIERIKLTGSKDGDMKQHIISAFAPLGKAILGGAIGETRVYSVNGEEHRIKILDIITPENFENSSL